MDINIDQNLALLTAISDLSVLQHSSHTTLIDHKNRFLIKSVALVTKPKELVLFTNHKWSYNTRK